MQVATPVGIKEDKRKKTVQREHSRGVQLLGLQEETRMNGVTQRSLWLIALLQPSGLADSPTRRTFRLET